MNRPELYRCWSRYRVRDTHRDTRLYIHMQTCAHRDSHLNADVRARTHTYTHTPLRMTLILCLCVVQAKLRLEMETERLRQTHSKEIESKDEEVEEIRQSCSKKVQHTPETLHYSKGK